MAPGYSPTARHEPKNPVEAVLMDTELDYQPLLGKTALLYILKSALEDIYPKIQEVALTGLHSVVVDVVLNAESFGVNNGLFKVWQLFESEKWRHGEDSGKVLFVIDNALKAVKNIAQFLQSQKVLDKEGYPIGRILCLSSEVVIMVFCYGRSRTAIDELSIGSCSCGRVLQHFQALSLTCVHTYTYG
eukprot:g37502.t1